MLSKIPSIQSQKTILVVGDQIINLQLLFKCLKKVGYKVFLASTGQQIIKLAREIIPDLIIFDVILDNINHSTLYKVFKNEPIIKEIPVIFITSLAETQYKIQRFDLKLLNSTAKSIDITELIIYINNYLSIQDLTQRLFLITQQQQLLFNFIERINQSLDLKIIFNIATQDVAQILQCDRLSLVRLINENIVVESQFITAEVNKNKLTAITFDSYNKTIGNKKKYYSGEIKVIENSHNSTINNIVNNLDLTSSKKQIQSQLIVPILLNQNTTKIHKYHPLWGWFIAEQCSFRKWQEPELTFLKQLTNQLNIAIKHGLLHQQMQNNNQQMQKNNQQLKQLAFCDPLTQISNRRYFERQLNKEWRRLKRIPSFLSVIFCDIDCFKIYNDTYGHQQGDQCLQKVAQALAKVIKRPADILARYGGEEFIVILPYTPSQGAITVAEAMRVAVKELKLPHANSTVNSVVTISVGVATTIPDSIDSPNILIEEADQALYQAKEQGRDCIAVYNQSIFQSKQQDDQLEWNKRIRYALQENLFRLYVQPITSLRDDDFKQHFEILLRLQDENGQIIAANVFLDVAERNFLMPSIDTWVINHLFEQLANKGDSKYWQNYQFSINLSGASLNNEFFLDFVTQKLAKYDLPPQLFCFEITEAIAIENINKIEQFILSLKNLGCSFALDDFGKGMSSLTYLKNLPVDYLKIDGSFITELNKDKVSKVMVEAINHLAVGIGLKTVAEFVENQAILDTLRQLKIDYAQGYHLGCPQQLTDVL
jgi:diguanylate cyclase (GGDEF)-like protein